MKTVHQYFMTGLGILFPVMVSAEVPVWWVEHGVIDTNMAENDYAPVNQGQAKHVAYRAYLTFEQVFGFAGSGVTDLISGFSEDDNLLLMNLGQLKYMAAPRSGLKV